MADVSDLLGGQYLSAGNVPQPLLVTISGAERVQMDGQPRLVVQFAEMPKGLLCNKTNLGTVAQMFGNDTSKWTGQKIVLFSELVQFQGKQVAGLRVRQPRTPQPVPVAPVVPPDLHQQQLDDPDCPF